MTRLPQLPTCWLVFGFGIISLIPPMQAADAATPSTNPSSGTPMLRVLHFPAGRSLGRLYVQDANLKREISTFHHWTGDGVSDKWSLLGSAQGDVSVPATKRVHLFVTREGWRSLAPLAKLAPDDLYEISFEGTGTSVNENRQRGLPATRNAPDSVMQHVGRLTGLKILDLQTTDITPKGMRQIEKLAALECLYLPRQANDEAMTSIAKATHIKRLYFKENKVTSKGLANLSALKDLEELELGGDQMSDEGLASLAGLPKLYYLMLWGDAFGDAGMKHLKAIPSLRTLVLFSTRNVTDAGLAEVAKVSTIQRLSLPWLKQIGDAGVSSIAQLADLRMLDITHTSATDKGTSELKKLTKLELLHMRNQANEPVLADIVANNPRLRSLTVGGSSDADYSDDLLERISKLSDLEKLLIGGKFVTDKGMEYLAHCRKLRELTLFDCPITDKGLAEIGRLEALQNLEIFDAHLTTAGLSQLNKLTRLERLRASRVSPVPENLDISGLVSLRDLILGAGSEGEPLRDSDLACLAKLKKLQSFQMEFCRGIGDAGLAHLAGLSGLMRLSIGGNVTDAGLAHLQSMPSLQFLTVTGNLTEEALLKLANPSLATLDVITPNPMSRNFGEKMSAHLPRLYLLRYGPDNAHLRPVGLSRGMR